MARFRFKALGTFAAMGLGLGLLPGQAQAALVLLPASTANTDCSGGPIANCYANQDGTATQGGNGALSSPFVFKYESNGTKTISTNFSSVITGAEFIVNYLAGTNQLSITYNPGSDDPEIHYISVKQGNSFRLFYDPSPILAATIDLTPLFPRNPGFSHVGFFDTRSPAVPEPSTWAMMMVGFGLLGASMRRRKTTATVRFAA